MQTIRKVVFLLILSILGYSISTVCMNFQQNHVKTEEMGKLFWDAAKEGKINLVKKLIDQGVDVNQRGSYEAMTVLHIAVFWGHHQVVLELLKHKEINVNAETLDHIVYPDGFTPLQIAADQNEEKKVMLLLDNALEKHSKKNLEAVLTNERVNNPIKRLIKYKYLPKKECIEKLSEFRKQRKYIDLAVCTLK